MAYEEGGAGVPRSNSQMIKKLQSAINDKFQQRLVINKVEFYSEDQNRPITMWSVKQALQEDPANKGTKSKRMQYVELFNSTSQIQIVLFLRDYWYKLNGWELPTDNPAWEKVKEKLNG